MTSRLIDVTPQILNHHRIYGASDNTNQQSLASSRSLNYAKGNTIQKAEQETVSNIPRDINYQDAVGLFGAENHFVKITLLLKNPVSGLYTLNGYDPALFSDETYVPSDKYTEPNVGGDVPGQAYIDYEKDLTIVNTYEPAVFGNADAIPSISSKYFKVELKNLKTGNIYIDSWLDVQLYNQSRNEHPYDVMYVKQGEFFYIGFHARNTKRLPYNVVCAIGQGDVKDELPSIAELGDFDSKYLATKR